MKHQLKHEDFVWVETVEQRHRIIRLAHKAGVPVHSYSDIGGLYGNEAPTGLYLNGGGNITGWPGARDAHESCEHSESAFIAKMFGVYEEADPVIHIGANKVQFLKDGSIKVGCTDVDYGTLAKVYEHATKKRGQ
jgi:hypothetical protein